MTGAAADSGASTVEAALGLATLVAVLVLCLAGVTAVSMQLRCLDAAREAARLTARGDGAVAAEVAGRLAPQGATIRVHRDGGLVLAMVTARTKLLPVLIGAESVSAAEPP